jgi:hypothetical protein
VLGVALLLMYLVVQACDGSGSGQTNEARPQARPSAGGTPPSTPTAGAQPGATGARTPGADQTAITDRGGSDPAGTGGAGGVGGTGAGFPGPAGSGSGDGSAGSSQAQVPLSGAPGCPIGTAQLVVSTDSRNYPAGRNPEFTLAVSNAGRSACRIDLRRHTAQFVVTSGPDRIWSTADCLKPQTANALVVEPGRSVLILRVEWRRVRSAPDCPADPQRAKPGTYVLTGSLTGLAGAKDVFGLR